MKNRRIKPLVLIAALAILLSSCGRHRELQLAMFDGEDKVLMAADSFSYKNHKVATESDSDSAVYNGSFGLFTGAETLWDSLKIPVPGEVTLSGSAKIESGAFKLILVSENGVETFYNADDGEDFSLTANLSIGRWRIKAVGREAEGSFTISATEPIF